MSDKLEFYGAWLCVKSEDKDYFEPRLIVHYYPIVKLYGSDRAVLADREGLNVRGKSNGNGFYFDEKGGEYQLLNAGGTLPIHTDITPVPCPKVRKGIETRWKSGLWEKYTKAHGWQLA